MSGILDVATAYHFRPSLAVASHRPRHSLYSNRCDEVQHALAWIGCSNQRGKLAKGFVSGHRASLSPLSLEMHGFASASEAHPLRQARRCSWQRTQGTSTRGPRIRSSLLACMSSLWYEGQSTNATSRSKQGIPERSLGRVLEGSTLTAPLAQDMAPAWKPVNLARRGTKFGRARPIVGEVPPKERSRPNPFASNPGPDLAEPDISASPTRPR